MMRVRKLLFLSIALLLLFPSLKAKARDKFSDKLKNLKWIAYAPTNFNPDQGIYPSGDSIRKDLAVLKAAGFNGLVTYGSESTLSYIPFIAKQTGFTGVIMGIWDIKSSQEIAAAVLAQNYVDGYCVGNEGYNLRYNFPELKQAITSLKAITGKPTTTTEQIYDYFCDPNLAELSDWLLVNAHPIFDQVVRPQEAVGWINERAKALKRVLGPQGYQKIVMIKETGFPTDGAIYYNQQQQQQFLKLMEETDLTFVYFEAFDQPWKRHLPIEPHWGLFDASRKPKQYIQTVKKAAKEKALAENIIFPYAEKVKNPVLATAANQQTPATLSTLLYRK